MRKLVFCICENKGADQLHQSFWLRYVDSTNLILPKSKISSLCNRFSVTVQPVFRWTVGNPEDRSSHDKAHMISAFNSFRTQESEMDALKDLCQV